MSWAEDEGYDAYDPPESMDDVERLFITTNNGTRICANCGSKNIKVSKKGNEYCADLCWIESAQPLRKEEQ